MYISELLCIVQTNRDGIYGFFLVKGKRNVKFQCVSRIDWRIQLKGLPIVAMNLSVD